MAYDQECHHTSLQRDMKIKLTTLMEIAFYNAEAGKNFTSLRA